MMKFLSRIQLAHVFPASKNRETAALIGGWAVTGACAMPVQTVAIDVILT